MKTDEMVGDLKSELRGRTLGYINTALSLVAGLAWNEAIISAIDTIFPMSKDTVFVKFIYAILVTIVIVILLKYLERVVKSK